MAATTAVLDTASEITCTVANTMYQVDLPLNCRSYTLQFRSNAGKLTEAGGTDATAITAEKWQDIVSDTPVTLPCPGWRGGRSRNLNTSTRRVWVSSATAGTVAVLTPRACPP